MTSPALTSLPCLTGTSSMKAVTRGTIWTDWMAVTRPMKLLAGATFSTCTGATATAGGGGAGAAMAAERPASARNMNNPARHNPEEPPRRVSSAMPSLPQFPRTPDAVPWVRRNGLHRNVRGDELPASAVQVSCAITSALHVRPARRSRDRYLTPTPHRRIMLNHRGVPHRPGLRYRKTLQRWHMPPGTGRRGDP